MLKVDSYDEILEILLQNIADEGCGHASYISNEDDITELLKLVNIATNAEPELINFDNSCEGYFVFELDYADDDFITYSIWPAADEEGIYNSNYGLCMVDECVPSEFEHDYDKYSKDDKDYIKPVRIRKTFGDLDCDSCKVNNCPNKKNSIKTSESTKIDTNDDGSLSGFTKTWKNNNSYFSYTFHSTNENDVLDLMDKFQISKPE